MRTAQSTLALALFKAEQRQRDCERAVVDERKDLIAARQRAGAWSDKCDSARQRLQSDRVARDTPLAASAARAAGGYRASMRNLLAHCMHQRTEAALHVRFCEQRVLIRTEELAEATARVNAYQALATQERKMRNRRILTAEDGRADEQATLRAALRTIDERH